MIPIQSWLSVKSVGLTVTAIALAILASAALPTPVPDRIATNEAAAIDALRTIAAAQVEFKAAVDIDTNCDGVGEYGYFAELAGSQPMRVAYPSSPCVAQAGSMGIDNLNPPLLRSVFGRVEHTCISHRGYLFQMWLPDRTAGVHTGAFREDWTGGKQAAPFPDPINGARMWCCYAWPISYNRTGQRAFFINQRGVVLGYSNRSTSPLSGYDPPRPWNYYGPYFDEAYSVSGDMGSPVRIGIPNANGSVWWPVQ